MNNETATMAELQVQIAENMPLVYMAGLKKGAEPTEAYKEGRKTEYEEFWEAFMPDQYEDYDSHFAGRGWTDVTFKPPYDIPRGDRSPTSFSRLFANTRITNLSTAMGDHKIQWNKATRADYMFYWAQVTEIPGIDVSNIKNCYAMLNSAANLVTIGDFKVSATTELPDAFYDCKALVNIKVIGELAYANISFAQSTKLSKASITSIIEALSKSTSGKTLTLSNTAVNNAFTTSEWNNLRASKSNWTISLV